MEQNWQGYITALGKQKIPGSSVDLGLTTKFITPDTGFQPIAVLNPNAQKKYDAMSGSWGGVSASESAVSSGVYKTSFMPVTNNK
jgi:hypothetical protein